MLSIPQQVGSTPQAFRYMGVRHHSVRAVTCNQPRLHSASDFAIKPDGFESFGGLRAVDWFDFLCDFFFFMAKLTGSVCFPEWVVHAHPSGVPTRVLRPQWLTGTGNHLKCPSWPSWPRFLLCSCPVGAWLVLSLCLCFLSPAQACYGLCLPLRHCRPLSPGFPPNPALQASVTWAPQPLLEEAASSFLIPCCGDKCASGLRAQKEWPGGPRAWKS